MVTIIETESTRVAKIVFLFIFFYNKVNFQCKKGDVKKLD